ncbi:hypothetical protein [Acinetobacter junii]|uniref:hypothetical protein n=1 Tax=Acinetobacter junii TaxID=40215 RepID=UPI001900F25E|nr:hypothetical protein [Acinetobacter junii]MBJ8442216.1 hypothetical protein [Acinetobacter junii]
MKLFSLKQKKHSIRRADIELLKARKANIAKEREKKRKVTLIQKYRVKYLVDLTPPQEFNIVNKTARTEFLFFMSKLRKYDSKGAVLLILDFKKVRKMGAEATLYFLAELETLMHYNNKLRFKILYSNTDIVNQVLYQTGILRLLKINKKMDSTEFDDSVKCWAYASGFNSQVTEKTKDIVKNLGDQFQESIEYTRGWFKVITEAMTNSHHHAYLEPRFKKHPHQVPLKKWWLFSKEVDGVLTVCICDLGLGIPESLKQNTIDIDDGWFDRVRNFVKELRQKYNEDSALIKAAIEIGKTRTKLPNRGKGLSQIINELQKLPNSNVSVSILSNKGGFLTKKPQHATSILVPFSDSIHGTIITWTVQKA